MCVDFSECNGTGRNEMVGTLLFGKDWGLTYG